MEKRIEIAQQVISLFKKQPEVRDASLRGSLAEGRGDEFSDIDITIDVSGIDNGQYFLRAVDLMHENFDLHFHDFNCSMVPEYYIANFYPKGVPIFWQIDIDCIAKPHRPSMSREKMRAIQDPLVHLLKLWAVYLRHLIRCDEGIEEQIRKVFPPRFGGDGWNDVSAKETMKTVLDEINRQANGRHQDFITQCYEVYEKELTGI